MLKKILNLFLSFIVYTSLIVIVCKYFYPDYILSLRVKYSYVIIGDMTEINKEQTQQVVDKINQTGQGLGVPQLIKSSGILPIYVKVDRGDLITKTDPRNYYNKDFSTNILGRAHITPYGCYILINKDVAKRKRLFQTTVAHELLHCYGYDRSVDPQDIMYYQSTQDDNSSIYNYIYDMVRHHKNFGGEK